MVRRIGHTYWFPFLQNSYHYLGPTMNIISRITIRMFLLLPILIQAKICLLQKQNIEGV